MATGIGNLVSNLTANTSGFTKGLNQARSSLSGFASFAASSMASFVGNLGASAFSSLTSGMKSLGVSALGLAADNEQTAISFEVMLGSADAATAMIGNMRDLAAKSPLEFKDVSQAGKTLLQFGLSANNVLPALRMLGDVSGGNAERFQSLALVFGQMSAAGRLMGQDLLQFINAGFNPLQEISRHTGESMVSLKAKMEAGSISADMVAESFMRATSQGGQFYGMTQRQSQTTAGLFSSLKDAVNVSLAEIGQALIDGFDIKGMMANVTGMAETFKTEWLPSIKESAKAAGEVFDTVVGNIRFAWDNWNSQSLATIQGWVSSAMSYFDGFGTSIAATFGDWFRNIDIYFDMGVQSAGLFVGNAIGHFEAFFENVGIGLTWFGNNWATVLKDVANLTLTAVKNMGGNFAELFKGIKDWATGKGFTANFSGLTDGFQSSLKDMPKFVDAMIAETTPEMDRLAGELVRRQTAAQQRIANVGKAAVAGIGGDADQFQLSGQAAADVKKAAKDTASNAPGLSLKGTKEALSNIFAAQRAGGASNPQMRAAKAAEQQVEEQRKTNSLIDKLVGQQVKTGEMVPLPL